ncbi:uncharacterized protein PV09_02324 [Verruconis gallopava]|uniref:Uncharacterized protein n=1 Tax=Verruconis gallopava TaxID=253628 RepID=A0A0D2AJ85_9PEZI|nr:uncharacterized protein PV09_02324 [Verruconis gallopava]KIW06610.1 hypothetical protein PV09_02324 [Verruconis gallopava]
MDSSFRLRQSFNIPTGSDSTKRPSPTPSVKRSKAEQLLKQHGSPPHVRVTAGGRIVPNDLPQLGSPRVPFAPIYNSRGPSRFQQSAIPSGPAYSSRLPNGFLAYNVYGKLIQWFNGYWHDVNIDAYGQPVFHISPPNIPFPSANAAFGYTIPQANVGGLYFTQQPVNLHASVLSAAPDDIEGQISVNKAEYERIRQEKIELERHEVKSSDHLSAAERAQIVNEKRKYVLMLDTIRKKIKELESIKNFKCSSSLSNGELSSKSTNGINGISGLSVPLHNIGGTDDVDGVPTVQKWQIQPHAFTRSFPGTSYGNVLWNTYPSPIAASSDHPPGHSKVKQQLQPENAIESPTSEPSPSSRAQPRRSHAVQIRNPNGIGHGDALKKESLSVSGEHHPSNLNPASPSYEPGKPYPLTEGSPPPFVVPAPTPIETPNPPPAELAKHWVFSQQIQSTQQIEENRQISTAGDQKEDGIATSESTQHIQTRIQDHDYVEVNPSSNEDNVEHSSQHQTSRSSVTTTDFFPVNTHEHSFNKYMSRKTSAAARFSMETNPCTPMRDQHSGGTSPMTDGHHLPVPPVSPASHYGFPSHLLANSPDDLRTTSFLGDTSCSTVQQNEEHIPQHSPVKAETRAEFHGKSKSYLEGYLAGSSGHAPSDPKNQEYCSGYIDGLSKMCLGGTNLTRESSTISLKSQMITMSRTPPNTTDNCSLIADLAGSQPNRSENLRLTQSLNFNSPSSVSRHTCNDAQANGSECQAQRTPYQIDNTKAPHLPCHDFQGPTHLPLSRSEESSGSNASRPKGFFLPSSGPWNLPPQQPKTVCSDIPASHSLTAVSSSTCAAARRCNRVVSTSNSSQPPLAGYSGNQPSARVGSMPQHSVFGDEKYLVATTTIEASKTATSRFQLHENQNSISASASRGSQFDGAVDELSDMKTARPSNVHLPMECCTSSVSRKTDQQEAVCTPRTGASSKMANPAVTTPSVSPSKSNNTTPKKITSPRHRMQQIKDKVGDFLDRGGHCGGSERNGDISRAESPDPKHMSPEEKRRWKDGWRSKLGAARAREDVEVRKWKKEKLQLLG